MTIEDLHNNRTQNHLKDTAFHTLRKISMTVHTMHSEAKLVLDYRMLPPPFG